MSRALWIDWVCEGLFKSGLAISDGVSFRAFHEDTTTGRFLKKVIAEVGQEVPILIMAGPTMHITLLRILENGTADPELKGRLNHSLPTAERNDRGGWWSKVTPVDWTCPKCEAPFPSYGNYGKDYSYNCSICKYKDHSSDF